MRGDVMARGPRRRLEDGVYKDAFGLAAVVTVNGHRKEKRFPAGIERNMVRIWRAETTALLLKTTPRPEVTRAGGFARDVARYLRTRKGRPSYKADRSHLKAWLGVFGTRHRQQIT